MNRWSSRKDALATWCASLDGDDERALEWIRRVLDAGESHAVYLSRNAMAGRDARELLRDFWLSHYDHAAQRYPAGARVAIHREDRTVGEVLVDDLGALSRSLHPALDEQQWIMDFRCRPPVSIVRATTRRTHRFEIALHSDIWMPWVWGFLEEEPRFPSGPAFDNRELAAIHTPRFNAFIAEVRAASDRFELVTEDAGQPFYYAWCASRAGIDLGRRPGEG